MLSDSDCRELATRISREPNVDWANPHDHYGGTPRVADRWVDVKLKGGGDLQVRSWEEFQEATGGTN